MSKQRENYFYKQLVPFLVGAYPSISATKAQALGSCAFDYFSVLLTIDHLIDSQEENINKPQILLETILLHERVIRQLCDLIDSTSVFWHHFDQLKKQYIQTVLAEKQLSVSKNDFEESNFEELAFGKSVICCAIVHGLQALCEQQANTEALEKILKHTHIAFQYLDDVSDFKQDIEETQWTYPQVLLKQYLATNALVVDTSNMQHKYLFLSGIGQKMVQKAVEHYQKAFEVAEQLGLVELKNYLYKQQNAAEFYNQEVNFLLEKTRVKAQRSQEIKTEKQGLGVAIAHGIRFLLQNATQGHWTDFMTSAGHGKTWISSYVGLMLSQCSDPTPFLKIVLKNLSEQGAYNDQIIDDADSSTFLVAFHQAITGTVPQKLLDNWLLFQNADGGWKTYKDEAALRTALDLDDEIGVQGWLSSHACVSAAAAAVLANRPQQAQQYEKTVAYLQNLIAQDKLQSYWWTSDVYACAFTILALAPSGYDCQGLVAKLLQHQDTTGCWLNPLNNTPNAFYTALTLKGLLSFESENHQAAIEKAAAWLLNNQTTDGSWLTDRMLRIPATDVTNPETVAQWRQSSFGVNALSDDYNRVFTTATVVNVLNDYQNWLKK